MRVAICDDEHFSLKTIKELIRKYYFDHDKLFISEFNNGEEFLAEFSEYKYDIIILDIEMNGISGLETAKIIRSVDRNVIVVFLTSHQEFALQGYEVDAFRYILKGQPELLYKQQLMSIFDEYHQTHMSFSVREENTVYNISVSDIIYFEVFKRVIVLHTKARNYEYYGKLSEIESDERLISFVKPHKSYYINIAFIDNVEKDTVVMKNKDRLPLSRNFKQSVSAKFVEFLTGRC